MPEVEKPKPFNCGLNSDKVIWIISTAHGPWNSSQSEKKRWKTAIPGCYSVEWQMLFVQMSLRYGDASHIIKCH